MKVSGWQAPEPLLASAIGRLGFAPAFKASLSTIEFADRVGTKLSDAVLHALVWRPLFR